MRDPERLKLEREEFERRRREGLFFLLLACTEFHDDISETTALFFYLLIQRKLAYKRKLRLPKRLVEEPMQKLLQKPKGNENLKEKLPVRHSRR